MALIAGFSSSCNKDDDNNNDNNGGNQETIRSVSKKNMVKYVGKDYSVDNKYDSDGNCISSSYESDYSYNYTYDVDKMICNQYESDGTLANTITIVLNHKGFVESAKSTFESNIYEYDDQGHVIKGYYNLDDFSSTTSYEWEDGNITKVTIDTKAGSWITPNYKQAVLYCYYTDKKNESPIENKTHLHVFPDDDLAFIDPILSKKGVSCKNLLLSVTTEEDGKEVKNTNYAWTLDKDGYPTKRTIDNGEVYDEIFTWK